MAVSGDDNSFTHTLTSTTPIFNLKLYVVICLIFVTVLILSFLAFLCYRSTRNTSRREMRVKHRSSSWLLKLESKDSIEMMKDSDRRRLSDCINDEFDDQNVSDCKAIIVVDSVKKSEIEVLGKDRSTTTGSSDVSGGSRSGSSASTSALPSAEAQNIGWGRWFDLTELQIATRGFHGENVIGEGGYGVVYKGLLPDGSIVAVKNLLNNKGQAEREFKVEVEAIGKVRHKNLVGLLGYCAEGAERMLVYEFIDNGNLEQWLHGDVGAVSPLTWDIRMRIAVGTAKGLAYLHEGLEPKVVHRDVKSSNILLDRNWNPKVSDFGLAKLLKSEASYVTTRVMGTFGYVSPEYASTGMLNEGSDVYSFGILLMEIVTGRSPVDYSRPPGEMNLVDWFKAMVSNRRGEELVDPLIEVQPPPRALKRALLVCLRCIDLDANKRPKMGQIVHMLDSDEFTFRSEHRSARDASVLPPRDVAATAKAPLPSTYAGINNIGKAERR